MSAAAVARCLRAVPAARAARSMVALSRNNVGGVYQQVPTAPACPQPDLLASVVRQLDGCRVDGIMLNAAAQGDFLPVVPVMEAVNRNARRPKKANHGKRPCSHVGRRRRRRRKNIIRNGP
ncbi:unnamed protein product [Ectocarpus sp. 12 AP-2014]